MVSVYDFYLSKLASLRMKHRREHRKKLMIQLEACNYNPRVMARQMRAFIYPRSVCQNPKSQEVL
jgi:hypothetical protein